MTKEEMRQAFINEYRHAQSIISMPKVSEPNIASEVRSLFKILTNTDPILGDESIDMTVYYPDTHENAGKVFAIFEMKSPNNTNEMVALSDFNRKAFHEILHHFLVAEFGGDDKFSQVEYYIITDLKSWFVFDRATFIDCFGYITLKGLANKLSIDKKTLSGFSIKKQEAYNIISDFIEKNPKAMSSFVKKAEDYYFVIQQYLDDEVAKLFDFLYDKFVFNKPKEFVSLNKDFYNELLYIMGLKEKEANGKKQVVYNGVTNSFAGQITKGTVKENDLLPEDKIQLLIVWFNRILFLKLLETNLVKFNGGDEKYKFLNKQKIIDSATLDKLFFDVMAVEEENRTMKQFENIPYLNSSLFEEQEVEKNGQHISMISNASLPPYSKTVLTLTEQQRQKAEIPLLDYLFQFLDAYDFNSGKEGTSERLISPAVLGLVFEKLNGYKDGSFYTPSEITNYMAEEAIKRAILERIREEANLDFKNYKELTSLYIDASNGEREKIKEAIMSLKIVDPAVGSAHFLVSALDVLLSIWYDLSIGEMENINHNKYKICIRNQGAIPVKIKQDGSEEVFVYTRIEKDNGKFFVNEEDQAFEKALFDTRRYIIENNLFGVDINPKAVEIARLRLWIELLKNTYYIEPDFVKMETLPNIDINIKVGDSLLAEIVEIRDNLFVLDLPDYLKKIHEYQETNQKEIKEKLREEINKQREKLVSGVNTQYKDFVWTMDFPQILNDDGTVRGFDVVIANPPYIQLQKAIDDKHKYGDLYQHMQYQTFIKSGGNVYPLFIERGINLLKFNGYLCYITSNKWMRAGYGSKLRDYIRSYDLKLLIDLGPNVFEDATVDTCIILLRKASPTMSEEKGRDIVALDISKEKDKKSIDLKAKVQADQVILKKLPEGPWFIGDDAEQKLKEKIEHVGKLLKDWDIKMNIGITTGLNSAFVINVTKKEEILQNCRDAEERKRTEAIIKPILRGRDIKRYYYEWAGLWILFVPWHFPLYGDSSMQGTNAEAEKQFEEKYSSVYRYLLQFKDELANRSKDEVGVRYEWYALHRYAATYYSDFEKEKLIYPNMSYRLMSAYDTNKFITNQKCFILTGQNLKYLCALFNSKLEFWYFKRMGATLGSNGYEMSKIFIDNLPLPPITSSNQSLVNRIEELVTQITEIKQKDHNADTSVMEHEIDKIVYKLYGLSDKEISIIEKGL